MAALAATAGSLTGLLFVALSVVRRPAAEAGRAVVQEIRAAAALLAFFNAMAVSLFSLVPGTNVGYPAVVLGLGGLLFTAASLRSIVASRAASGLRRQQAGLVIVLLLIFGSELVNGIRVLVRPHSSSPVEDISYALAASVLVGIARAWELVGGHDTGMFASVALLAGRPAAPPPAGPAGGPGGDPPSGGADTGGAAAAEVD
jgi:hypothetical protein